MAVEPNGALDAALRWIGRGFLPVPVRFKSKKPYNPEHPKGEGWEKLRITAENAARYFDGRKQNCGILTGDDLGSADVDLDCLEALRVASTFLPDTGIRFGRPSKSSSHWLYRIDPPIPSEIFKDPSDKTVLVELRCRTRSGSIGFQTVVPPSLHESGEPIRFEQGFDRHPANVDAEELRVAVRRIAAAALLARHWPEAGQGRHVCELALAGALANAAWNLEDARRFVLGTYKAVRSHDPTAINRVEEAVRSTFTKRQSGAEVTGIPTLIQYVGEDIVQQALRWLSIRGVRRQGAETSNMPQPMQQGSVQNKRAGLQNGQWVLPEIKVNGRELRESSAAALEAVNAANDPPKLFSRGGTLVRVDQGEDGRPIITGVTDVHLRGEMTRAANFFKLSKLRNEFVRTPVSPPLDVARDLLSRPIDELRFPVLDSVIEAPFIRPDGQVVCRPGYDSVTRTYYSPAGDMHGFGVLENPNADDLDGAIGIIEEVFHDFPFVDQASRANALALFITPELRPAILGNVPAALADAPQPGSGKSLLAEVVSIKSTGTNAAMKPAPVRDDEEWRKVLTATIQAGQGLAVFDNVDHLLGSSNLALALTAGTWTDRVLGKTALVTLPQRTIFVVTGNNLILGGDLPRRCYWIRLDAKTSEPWRKREYRHADLKGWVRLNRGRLLSAVLTLARAWFVAGCPSATTASLGSFEEWCRIVGGILAFAGVEGFLGNLDDLYRQSDPLLAAWEAFLFSLKAHMPSSGFKVADVVAKVRDDQSFHAVLPEDLGDLDPLGSFQRRLGKAFLKRANRRFGEKAIHLLRMDMRQGAVVWGVRGGAE